MAIEHINEFDTLNAGREKINKHAIDPANRAEINSIDAKNVANQSNQTSQNAEAIAINTDDRLDNIITGEMQDGEVIDARRPFGSEAYPTLGDRLDEADKHFLRNESEIKQISTPYDYEGAVVTFIDDDGKDSFMNLWKPVCDAKGIKVTLALVSSWVGGTNRLTLGQIKALQSDGYDFASHSFSHDASVFNSANQNLETVPDYKIEDEYKKGQDWMRANGVCGYDTIVYPWGNFYGEQELRYKRLARKYFKHGVSALGDNNTAPNDNIFLNRKFIKNTNDINQYKQAVDNAIDKNAWLIFGTHSVNEEISVEYLTELVDYIQSKNLPILSFNEGLKCKGNAISVGEKKGKDKFYVGSDGSIELNFDNSLFINKSYSSDSLLDTLIENYNIGITNTPIRTVNDYLENRGGLLTTYRAFNVNGTVNDTFSYQSFKPINSSAVFYRFWDWENGRWKEWLNSATSGTITFNTKWRKADDRKNDVRKEGNIIVGNISLKREVLGGISHGESIATISGVQLPTGSSHFFTSTYFTTTSSAPTGNHAFALTSDGSIVAQGSYTGNDIDRLYVNFAYTV